jgi:hypothetical protein
VGQERFFKQNALRLLAEEWQTPRQLAQQLYLIATEEPKLA